MKPEILLASLVLWSGGIFAEELLIHPGYEATDVAPSGAEGDITGIDFFPDGRCVFSTSQGKVYLRGKAGWTIFAQGLNDPQGLKILDDAIYVLQRQELTRLRDTDNDELADAYECLNNHWDVTELEEKAYGLVEKNGWLYGSLALTLGADGRAIVPQVPNRGTAFRISRDGQMEFLAAGFRALQGLTLSPQGVLLGIDERSSWAPAAKLISLERGAFYGTHSEPASLLEGVTAEKSPVLWLPAEAVSRPSQLAFFREGIFEGQAVVGDRAKGDLHRIFFEKINGQWQGVLLPFGRGLKSGVTSLNATRDGSFYAGGGNDARSVLWKIQSNEQLTFEVKAIRIERAGFEVELTKPLKPGTGEKPEEYQLDQFYYLTSADGGGAKVGWVKTAVTGLKISSDRLKVFLVVPDLRQRHVVHFVFSNTLTSAEGEETLWTPEAWYTLNSIPDYSPAEPSGPINGLSDEEKKEGWELLFDGLSTEKWRGSGRADFPAGWMIQDGALCRSEGGCDLLTREEFKNFELKMDWKIAPGGTSGIYYRAVEVAADQARPSGLGFRLLDDLRNPDGKLSITSTGALDGLVGVEREASRPAGSWNESRIVVQGGRLEHWLNGVRVMVVDMTGATWMERLAHRGFTEIPPFARVQRGAIRLQDGGYPVWYRNLKIRRL